MKVAEQALYLGQLKGLSQSDANQKMNYWFKKLDMLSWKNKKVEDLSKGMSQKLQFVITVMHNPRLLILDEPCQGLDQEVSARFIALINDICVQMEKTLIYVSHYQDEIPACVTFTLQLKQGKIAA